MILIANQNRLKPGEKNKQLVMRQFPEYFRCVAVFKGIFSKIMKFTKFIYDVKCSSNKIVSLKLISDAIVVVLENLDIKK